MFEPKTISLVFSDLAIKACCLKRVRGGHKVVFLVEKKLPPGCVFNGRIADLAVFEENLKDFYRENFPHFKNKKARLGINEQEVFFSAENKPAGHETLLSQTARSLEADLPFKTSEAKIALQTTDPDTFQVVAVDGKILKSTVASFTKIGFEIETAFPLPQALQALVGSQRDPYVLISSEENNLLFFVCHQNTIVFSSSLYLKAQIESSKDPINKTTDEVLEEYSQRFPDAIQLRNIFLVGKDSETLKSFFLERSFNPAIIPFLDQIDYQYREDLINNHRLLALAAKKEAQIEFLPLTRQLQAGRSSINLAFSKRVVLLILVVLFALALLGLGYIFFGRGWLNRNGKVVNNSGTSKKVATESTLLKPKEPTVPPEPKIATPTPTQTPAVNR